MEYALMVDAKDCVGCNACEVACKQEHNLPVGPRWIMVFPDSLEEIEGRLQLRYVVTHCMHCSQPLCRDVCPVGAITKREDGIVLIFLFCSLEESGDTIAGNESLDAWDFLLVRFLLVSWGRHHYCWDSTHITLGTFRSLA